MNQLVKPGRDISRRQLVIAIIITLISTAFSYIFWGLSHAQSALVGGAIGIIPNFVFGLFAFRYAGATASKQVMKSFNQGAKLKMVLTALFFALAFNYLDVSFPVFFTTYILSVAAPIGYAAVNKFTFNQQ